MFETLGNYAGMTLPFHMPNIQGRAYNPGPQPNSPGETVTPWQGAVFNLLPTPNPVPVMNLLIGNPGRARERGLQQDVNRYSTLPENYLFIAGFVGKSKG